MALVYHTDKKWFHVEPANVRGGEADLFNVVGHPDRVVTAYHPGKEPEELAWWADHLSECLAGLDGVVKCHGLVRTAPDGPVFGVLWQRAPGRMAQDDMPKSVRERVRFALRCVEVLIAMLGRGLIYSDVKPDNLFRDCKNRPWFIDLLSCSSACDLEYPDGETRPRQFEMGSREYAAPELRVKGAAHVNTPATLAHSALVLVWVILKDDYPFDLVNQFGVKVPRAEREANDYYGRFTADPLPDYLTPLDNGIPYADLNELTRWVFELGFVQGRLAPQVRPSLPQIRDALGSFDRALARKTVWWRAAALALTLTAAAAAGLTAISTGPTAKPPAQKEPDAPNLWRR